MSKNVIDMHQKRLARAADRIIRAIGPFTEDEQIEVIKRALRNVGSDLDVDALIEKIRHDP